MFFPDEKKRFVRVRIFFYTFSFLRLHTRSDFSSFSNFRLKKDLSFTLHVFTVSQTKQNELRGNRVNKIMRFKIPCTNCTVYSVFFLFLAFGRRNKFNILLRRRRLRRTGKGRNRLKIELDSIPHFVRVFFFVLAISYSLIKLHRRGTFFRCFTYIFSSNPCDDFLPTVGSLVSYRLALKRDP